LLDAFLGLAVEHRPRAYAAAAEAELAV